MSHETGITVTKKENFNEWYIQLVKKAKLIEYYDISGCYVLLPNSYGIWEQIQKYLDIEFKRRGIENAYFPLFISKKNLEKEKNHIEGFTPEVAWVTKSGSNDMSDPIAVRPTSECAIYSVLPNLIQSYNDLPLKLNQWCNVVRWEFKDPMVFIRSKEFLWTEIHSAYEDNHSAQNDVLNILDLYHDTFANLLAVPTIKGKKTEREKFAGADATFTIEAFIPEVGKGIQAATSHNLGQNFSKMFDIKYQNRESNNEYVWQISCGITTRSIGIMLMNHGDDKGAIIPPKVAPTQIVIIPISFKNRTEDVIQYTSQVFDRLKNSFRVKVDNRNHNPGWKFNYWETMGVPLRIEIGPKEVDNNKLMLCKRTTFDKFTIENDNSLINNINIILEQIHSELYCRASQQLISHIKTPSDQVSFNKSLEDKNLCYINWCGTENCENVIKDQFKAKSLCIPINLNLDANNNNKCCICGLDSTMNVLFGKSY